MFRSLLLTIAVLYACPAPGQIGDKADRPGEVQRSLVPPELVPPSPPLSPADALKSFKLQPGLQIECVASEPLVEDPVVAAFDPDGRLWVVEMRGYMPDLDGNGEDAPIGRIVILTDSQGDGRMDQRTVFADGLVLPRALAFANGGVLVGAPPHLWFLRDAKGDGRADIKIEIASDYGVAVDPKRPELANPERAPNSLLWALDNWIYSAAYMTRLRFQHGEWQRGLTIFRGQWGLTQDETGRLYYDSNSDQLRYDAIPAYYLGRNPNLSHPAGNNVDAAENQLCWPARVNPGVNRGYRASSLRDGRLKEFTAACAPFTLCSDLFPPDFYGNVFVAEPAGNLVRRNRLANTNGVVRAQNAYDQAEFLASTDERFRPVNFTSGPDGALYIVDLYRGVIQHRISLTTYLRNQSVERGLDQPIHLGRIYRVVPEGNRIAKRAHFSRETPEQWVGHLSHSNSWWRNTAQRLLVERREPATVGPLLELVRTGARAAGRWHALWTLEGMGALDLATVKQSLRDPDARVRATAIRLAETFLTGEDREEMLGCLIALQNDVSSEVLLQLALTLGEAHGGRADPALANLANSGKSPAFLTDAILSGVHGRELELLDHLLIDPAWKSPGPEASRVLKGLAGCVALERNSQRVGRLLDVIAQTPSETLQRLLLDGLLGTANFTQKKPIKLPAPPPELALLEKSGQAEIAQRALNASALLTWPGKPGARIEIPLPTLSVEQQRRFAAGRALFQGSCAACHQLHGMGMDGLAPPLVDSEWVLGSEQRLVRILLKGLHGPVSVGGKSYNLDMPSMGFFDDEQIASLLTFVRREWDNPGTPVEPESVKSIRAAAAQRQEAWSEEELLRLP